MWLIKQKDAEDSGPSLILPESSAAYFLLPVENMQILQDTPELTGHPGAPAGS